MSSALHHLDRAVLHLSGPDASAFLQGLITNDMALLEQQACLYAALLTPQGKLIFDFFIFRKDDDYYVDCLKEQASALLQRLMMYRLRSKVELADVSDHYSIVSATVAEDLDNGVIQSSDPRSSEMGFRGVIKSDNLPEDTTTDSTSYHQQRIQQALPDGILDMGHGETLVLEGNFDQIQGVSFKKGCYVGQENTARMNFRNKVNRRLVPIHWQDEAPSPNSTLFCDEKKAGSAGLAVGSWGLAHLRLEKIQDGSSITTEDGKRGTIHMPQWMQDLTIKA